MPLRFRKRLIAPERFEAGRFMDVDGDGVLDILSGEWWYRGPAFRERFPTAPVKTEGEYYDHFSAAPLDITGNGRPDVVTGGWWGDTVRWWENPGEAGKPWNEHIIATCGNVETTRLWDVDGDGRLEVVPNTPGRPLVVYKLVVDGEGRGTGAFEAHTVYDQPQGHGLGFGDLTGNGRGDFVLAGGWLEAPEKPFEQDWTWHPDFNLGSASVPVLVVDVDGDGLNDLIVGQSHAYGLSWWQQRLSNGQRTWVEHPIDPCNSQYHDLRWVDIDGDGAPELVTGKRFRAHCGKDPGGGDPVGVYYFKWTGEGFAKQVIDYGEPLQATGCGIELDLADLTGNGYPDLLAPGKDGLYVFYNEGPA